MKKIYSIIATAIIAVGFTACTQNDFVETAGPDVSATSIDNAIQFGTYMGKVGTTRAGYENTTGMTTALLQNDGATTGGFGVFAYYTGKNTYGQQQGTTYSTETTPQSNIAPNFMYNQQVTYSTDHWTYTPLKYWPNDFADGTAVDTQTGAAIGSSTYGGNVSFFAYAPYVSAAAAGDGITGMSANTATGDPTITYTMPSDINTGGAFVDLLWGTLNGTSTNVLSSGNVGVEGTGTQGTLQTTYAATLLDDYFTNADLNKQKVDGTVGFSFKHALAKVGGAGNGTTTGFLIKLDIDNSTDGAASTAINGGSRQEFRVASDNDAWRTIVTVKSITITNDLDGSGAINGDEVGLGGVSTLNLATGQWNVPTSTAVFTQTIGANAATTYNAEISSKIAEMYDNSGNDATWISKYGTITDYFVKALTAVNTGDHPGVTETAQSVYNESSQTPIILYPGTTPKFKITVDYVVRTYDANLAATKPYSEVEQIITKTIEFGSAVKLNKHYSILMHLGLTSVKFTATVADWDTDINGDSNTDADDAEQVHLPINVKD